MPGVFSNRLAWCEHRRWPCRVERVVQPRVELGDHTRRAQLKPQSSRAPRLGQCSTMPVMKPDMQHGSSEQASQTGLTYITEWTSVPISHMQPALRPLCSTLPNLEGAFSIRLDGGRWDLSDGDAPYETSLLSADFLQGHSPRSSDLSILGANLCLSVCSLVWLWCSLRTIRRFCWPIARRWKIRWGRTNLCACSTICREP